MARLVGALALMLGIAAPVLANESCKCAAASCYNLPAASTDACSSIISSSKIKLSTCTVPSSTTVKTVTVQPKSTTTVVATSTRTILQTKHRSSTAVTSTITDDVTEGVSATITVTESVVSTSEILSTITSTSIIAGQPAQTCTPVAVPRALNRRAVPSDCSCFLTTTKTAGVKTSTTTLTLPVSVVTKTAVSVSTVTSSFVGTTSTETVTVEETISTTELATETETATSTYIAVSAVTTVVSAYGDPCADAGSFFSNYAPSIPSGDVALGSTGDYFGDYYCCQDCYNNNDCVYWASGNNLCYVYFIKNSASVEPCGTQSCRKGTREVTQGPADGRTYGLGPCAVTA